MHQIVYQIKACLITKTMVKTPKQSMLSIRRYHTLNPASFGAFLPGFFTNLNFTKMHPIIYQIKAGVNTNTMVETKRISMRQFKRFFFFKYNYFIFFIDFLFFYRFVIIIIIIIQKILLFEMWHILLFSGSWGPRQHPHHLTDRECVREREWERERVRENNIYKRHPGKNT